jgi:hypothetical protein
VTESFKTLSDLVADAEDLLGRLDSAESPDIRVLKQRVSSSIRDMRTRFKQSLKAAHRPIRHGAGGDPWVPATAATLIALALLYVVFATPDER